MSVSGTILASATLELLVQNMSEFLRILDKLQKEYGSQLATKYGPLVRQTMDSLKAPRGFLLGPQPIDMGAVLIQNCCQRVFNEVSTLKFRKKRLTDKGIQALLRRMLGIYYSSVSFAEHTRQIVRQESPTGVINPTYDIARRIGVDGMNEVRSVFPNVNFTLSAESQIPLIRCCPLHLDLLFGELVKNSCNYGASKVEIRLRVQKDPAVNNLFIENIDDGIGIPEANLDKVALIGYTSQSGRPSVERGGFGLGIPKIKAYCQFHNGRLEISALPTRGTLFRVVLPLTSLPLQAEGRAASSPAVTGQSAIAIQSHPITSAAMRQAAISFAGEPQVSAGFQRLAEALEILERHFSGGVVAYRDATGPHRNLTSQEVADILQGTGYDAQFVNEQIELHEAFPTEEEAVAAQAASLVEIYPHSSETQFTDLFARFGTWPQEQVIGIGNAELAAHVGGTHFMAPCLNIGVQDRASGTQLLEHNGQARNLVEKRYPWGYLQEAHDDSIRLRVTVTYVDPRQDIGSDVVSVRLELQNTGEDPRELAITLGGRLINGNNQCISSDLIGHFCL
jgi:signal transduction histidine kinase